MIVTIVSTGKDEVILRFDNSLTTRKYEVGQSIEAGDIWLRLVNSNRKRSRWAVTGRGLVIDGIVRSAGQAFSVEVSGD